MVAEVKMTSIQDMLSDDQAFEADFCSDTTIARLRGVPPDVLRAVLRYFFENINFSAVSSPRKWSAPHGGPQPVVVFGKLVAHGAMAGTRFGLCTDTNEHEDKPAEALYVWATEDLVGSGSDWVPWRNNKRRLKNSVAVCRNSGWEVRVSQVLDATGFLNRASEVQSFGPTRGAEERLRTILRSLGHIPGFITPRAVDMLRHPD